MNETRSAGADAPELALSSAINDMFSHTLADYVLSKIEAEAARHFQPLRDRHANQERSITQLQTERDELREELARKDSSIALRNDSIKTAGVAEMALRTDNAALREEVERLKVHASAAVKQGEHWHKLAETAEARCTALEEMAAEQALEAEIERWRDSNIRLRDECEHQAKRANDAEYHCKELDGDKYEWQLKARAELIQLRQEIEFLRLYGNKDCTAMADEALTAARQRKD